MVRGLLVIPEVAALPDDDYIRHVAEPVLLQFHHVLQNAPDLQPEEQELIMVMHKSWSEVRKEGREEGREEALRHTLRKLLTIKFGELGPDIEARLATATADQLDRYLERILFADSLAAVFA